MSAVILFKEWVPSSGGAYVASCLAIIALAVVVQALKALAQQAEARWEAQRTAGSVFIDGSGSGSPSEAGGTGSLWVCMDDGRQGWLCCLHACAFQPHCAALCDASTALPIQHTTHPALLTDPCPHAAYGHALSRSSMESANGHEPRRSSAMSTVPMLRGMGSANARSSLSNGVDGAYVVHQQPLQFVTREELVRNTQRALFTGATIFLDLMLMLVVMTFNLGLIICVTLGYMLGALAFGHLKERVPAAAYASGAKAAPTNPLFIVGSMQPTAEEPYDPLQLEQQRSLRQIHTQA
jgi:hypothetical protein